MITKPLAALPLLAVAALLLTLLSASAAAAQQMQQQTQPQPPTVAWLPGRGYTLMPAGASSPQTQQQQLQQHPQSLPLTQPAPRAMRWELDDDDEGDEWEERQRMQPQQPSVPPSWTLQPQYQYQYQPQQPQSVAQQRPMQWQQPVAQQQPISQQPIQWQQPAAPPRPQPTQQPIMQQPQQQQQQPMMQQQQKPVLQQQPISQQQPQAQAATAQQLQPVALQPILLQPVAAAPEQQQHQQPRGQACLQLPFCAEGEQPHFCIPRSPQQQPNATATNATEVQPTPTPSGAAAPGQGPPGQAQQLPAGTVAASGVGSTLNATTAFGPAVPVTAAPESLGCGAGDLVCNHHGWQTKDNGSGRQGRTRSVWPQTLVQSTRTLTAQPLTFLFVSLTLTFFLRSGSALPTADSARRPELPGVRSAAASSIEQRMRQQHTFFFGQVPKPNDFECLLFTAAL